MVRVGFIVEGDSEKILIDSQGFRAWANQQGLEVCNPVINAKGGGNLLPHHMGPMVERLLRSSPQHIVVLTDLEYAASADAVKERITNEHTRLIFVAVKALEAWFLADTAAMRSWLQVPGFIEPSPEQTQCMPWDYLKQIARAHGKRGPGTSKVSFAKRICEIHAFDVSRAAAHAACPSAKEFHDALVFLGV